MVSFFAVWGGFTGFSWQMAQAVAGVSAISAALPLGRLSATWLGKSFGLQPSLAVLVGTCIAFLSVYLLVRLVVRTVVGRLLSSKDGKLSAGDRFLGLLLSALKSGGILWFLLSVVVMIEQHLHWGAKSASLMPSDSMVVAWVKSHNLLELIQLSRAKALLNAAQASLDGRARGDLRDNPHFAALSKDNRFRELLQSDSFRKAVEKQDVRALFAEPRLTELLSDPRFMEHLEQLDAKQ